MNSRRLIVAACRATDPDLFFSDNPADVDQAKQTCSGCPARGDCLSYALAHEIEFGVWGGSTPEERQTLRNTRHLEEVA
jgi:WhiB family redox-sensing transcriptional regulator